MGELIGSVSIEGIFPSVENDEVYGCVDTSSTDFIALTEDIAKNGIREIIVVSRDGYIISGHRRYAAARLLGHEIVRVRVHKDILRSDYTPEDWKTLLVSYNLQREKTFVVRIKEAALRINPDIAYEELCVNRDQHHDKNLKRLVIQGEKVRAQISAGKQQMLYSAIRVIESLREFWPLSVRQIHYQLLNDPPSRNTERKSNLIYQNDRSSYQDLCDLLTRARIIGQVDWQAISDETRPTSNTRFHRDAADFFYIDFTQFLRNYRRDLLQSQLDHVELVVEKLTVQNIIAPVAAKYCLPMTVGRGYCSLDPRKEIVERYRRSGKRKLILLIASDFDPDGEEIADSMVRSLRDDFGVSEIEASKVLLRQDQVKAWGLKQNHMEAKASSSRYNKFVEKYGSKQVFELEAVEPIQMQQAVEDSIRCAIDIEAFAKEVEAERIDAGKLAAIKAAVKELLSDLDMSGLGA